MSSCEPIQAPGAAEANYIVYILDGVGKIRGAEWIAAVSDEHALAQVRALGCALGCASSCELWQRDRRVGRVGPAAPRTA